MTVSATGTEEVKATCLAADSPPNDDNFRSETVLQNCTSGASGEMVGEAGASRFAPRLQRPRIWLWLDRVTATAIKELGQRRLGTTALRARHAAARVAARLAVAVKIALKRCSERSASKLVCA